MQKRLMCLIWLIFLNSICFGQAVFQWVLTPPSASIIGMGGGGTGFHFDDPLSVYYNPANGLAAYEGISINYARYYEDDFYIMSDMKLGYDFQYYGANLVPAKFPFKVVISQQRFDYDIPFESMIWDEETGEYVDHKMNSIRKSIAYSLSFGYANTDFKIPLNISAGISVKNVKDAVKDKIRELFNEKATMIDFGFISEFPFIFSNVQKLPGCKMILAPSFGMSVQNIGNLYEHKVENAPYWENDTIAYKTVVNELPLPRQFNIGFSIHGKLEHQSGINLVDFVIYREISDLLVKSKMGFAEDYHGFFRDIDLYDNFILNNSKNVNIYSGLQLSVIDLLSLRYGFDKLSHMDTRGIGVKSDGLFYLLKFCSGRDIFSLLPNYLTISYDYAITKTGTYVPFIGKNPEWKSYNTYSLKLKNLENLITKNFKQKEIPVGNGKFSILLGMNYSHFQDRLITQMYDKKFGMGLNFGMEKEFGPLNINLSYKNKSILQKEKLSAEDKEYGEKAEKVEMDLDYLSLASLIPLNLTDNLTFLPGFEIAQAISDEFDPWSDTKIKCAPNYNILLCSEWKMLKNYELRFEYSHGLNAVYNIDISEIHLRSFSVYLKYKFTKN